MESKSIGSIEKWMDKHAYANNIPLKGMFELTHRCNLSCCHCYIDEKERDLRTDEICHILGAIKGAGCFQVTFTGGEIFTRTDVAAILSHARDLYMCVQVLTNGTLIDEEVADLLHDLCIDKVQVSIYSSREDIHDSITRVPGSFSKSVRALKLLAERNVPIQIAAPVMRQAGESYKGLVSIAEDLGARLVLDAFITPSRSGSSRPTEFQVSRQVALEVLALSMDQGDSDGTESHLKDRETCSAGRSFFAITPSGNVIPCPDLPIVLGNALAKDFRGIWEGKEANELRAELDLSNFASCLTCDLMEFCPRCPGRSYCDSGNMHACSWHTRMRAETYRLLKGGENDEKGRYDLAGG